MATHAGRQDPAIQEILDFWFGLNTEDWFGNKHDKYIIEKFGPLVEKARNTDELDASWTSTPSGTLALIILLDQFTRNIFRAGNHSEPGLAFSGDAKAREIATQALMRGWDKQMQQESAGQSPFYRSFFYLPFQHHEDMKSQNLSCALYESMGLDFEVQMLQKELKGEELSENEKSMRKLMKEAIPFAARHRDCIAQHGRFPKRNEALGRDSTAEEKEWLESHPMGF